jgi:hypothetical protein
VNSPTPITPYRIAVQLYQRQQAVAGLGQSISGSAQIPPLLEVGSIHEPAAAGISVGGGNYAHPLSVPPFICPPPADPPAASFASPSNSFLPLNEGRQQRNLPRRRAGGSFNPGEDELGFWRGCIWAAGLGLLAVLAAKFIVAGVVQ